MAIVYFLYSDEQIKEKNEILARTSKKFEPGIVTVQGKKQKYTQLSKDPNALNRFVDTKIIASGEESNYTYTLPKAVIAKKG